VLPTIATPGGMPSTPRFLRRDSACPSRGRRLARAREQRLHRAGLGLVLALNLAMLQLV